MTKMNFWKPAAACFAAFLFSTTVAAQTGSPSAQDIRAAIERGEREIAADPWNHNAYTNHRLALHTLAKQRKAGRTDLPDVQVFVDKNLRDHQNNICAIWSNNAFRPWKGLDEYTSHVESSLKSHTDTRGNYCASMLAKDIGIELSKAGQYKRAEEFFVMQKKLDPKDPFVDQYIRETKEKAHTKMMQDIVRVGAAEGSKEPKRVVMPNGGIYNGQVNTAGQPHGKGRLETPSGNVYEGSFFDGQMTGLGVYKYANGRKYEGEMYKNNFHGKGRYDATAWIYTGAFYLGKMTGKGTVRHVSGPDKGSEYEGDFVDGKPHGWGTYRDKDGQVHAGTFENGRLVKAIK